MRDNKIKAVFLKSRDRQAGFSAWDKSGVFTASPPPPTWRMGKGDGAKERKGGRKKGKEGRGGGRGNQAEKGQDGRRSCPQSEGGTGFQEGEPMNGFLSCLRTAWK